MRFPYMAPTLYVESVSDSVRFYCDVLGFSEWFAYRDEDGLLVAAGVARDGARFILDSVGGRLTAEELAHRGKVIGFYISVGEGDIDALYHQFREKARIIAPVEDKPWGDRVFTLADPDGYRLSFCREQT